MTIGHDMADHRVHHVPMTQEPGTTRRVGHEPEPDVVEWRPGTSSAITWNIAGLVITFAGLVLFAQPAILRSGSASGEIQFGLADVLLVLGITVLLMVVHEAIHGGVMRGLGARPRFGALLVGRLLPALYTTADGHRFTRSGYLVVASAPAVVISVVGFALCFGPWAAYLVVPLAIHLGGCTGDGFAVLRTLREPSTTRCEDLREGIRFHRAPGPGVAG
jgi:hypothetical protein